MITAARSMGAEQDFRASMDERFRSLSIPRASAETLKKQEPDQITDVEPVDEEVPVSKHSINIDE